uniref:Mannosyltransferase n=1 Tax=Globodera rostochiensis TaxID=31243 RepID=A0A914I2I2_GLORO
MFSILKLAVEFPALRFVCLAFSTSWFVPDEVFQSVEVAYRMVYGRGYLAWEWNSSWALRSSLHPLLYAAIFWTLRTLRLDFGPLIRWAPHLFHALLFSVADAFYLKWTHKLGLGYNALRLTTVLYASNWFLLYCSTRTLSNSIECCLSMIALALYEDSGGGNGAKGGKEPNLPKSFALCVFCVTIATILRPTTLFLWAQLILMRVWHLSTVNGCFDVNSAGTTIFRLASICLAPLVLSLLSDSLYYGKPVLCLWNFLQFNVLSGGSALFGANHWSWYLTHAVPPLLTFLIIPLLTVLFHFRQLKVKKRYAVAALIYLTGHSLISHKEHRFLLPILPFVFPYLALELSKYKSKWAIIIKYCYIASNLLLAVYFGLIHQRGPAAVNGRLIELVDGLANSRDHIKILQLMPCFSLPQYAHLHPYANITEIKMLDCSPKFARLAYDNVHYDDDDEADKFHKDPEGWLNSEWYKRGLFDADIVVAYENVYRRIERFLMEKGFSRDSKIFHTHFPDSTTRRLTNFSGAESTERTKIENKRTIHSSIPKDAFEQLEEEEGTRQGFCHIRIQQRTGRKTITTVQGIAPEYDLKKIVRYLKKEYNCNGTIVEHPEYGEVIQLTGDQRQHIKDFLCKVGIVKEDNCKIHGF